MRVFALGIRRPRRIQTGLVVALLAFAFAVSCDSPIGRESEPVDRIALTPTSGSVQVGATLALAALVLNAEGNPMRDRKIVWTSENPRIASVNQTGVVVGVAAGIVQIAASSGGKSASALISVSARPVTLVRITPGTATISVASTIDLQVEALDASGAPVLGRSVAWKSSNAAVATVSADGLVAGLASGAVTITATIDGRDGTAEITVAPQPVAGVVITPMNDTLLVGGRAMLRAAAVDAQNAPLANRVVFWSSNNPTVANVSSEGEVFAFAPGAARIRATVEGKFSDASIVVQPVPVARVIPSPNQVTLNPGQTSQLTVTLNDSAGNALTGRSVTFTSSDAAIASVSATGLVTAVTEGSASIDVASEGVRASVAVTVNPIPIAVIVITPNAASLRVTQTRALSAQALDAQGRPLANRAFTWSSSNASVATVNQSGVVAAVAVGSASISASSEGQSGNATITVVPEPVNSVTLTSPRPFIVPGDTMHLTVVLRDAQNNVLTGRPGAFSATPAGRVSVDAAGVVTGVGASGTSDVTATSEGKSATIQISSAAAIASMTAVGPTNSALDLIILPGGTKRFTVTLLDGTGNPVQGQVVSARSSSSVVTLSSGTLTTGAQGSATVDISANALAGSATVTFQAARAGAIPPATPGNNNASTSLVIVVP